MCYGLLVVIFTLHKAWGRLRKEENAVATLGHEAVSEAGEMRQRLDKINLDTAQVLRVTLDTGQVDTSILPFYEDIHWARYWAGIFVFLGLLGTVIGISTAIANLGVTVSATGASGNVTTSSSAAYNSVFQQSTQLQQSIGGLLAGIKSASVCTFFGIAFTFITSLMNSFYMRKSQDVEQSVARLANRRFLPLWQQEMSHAALSTPEQSLVQQLTNTVRSLQEAAADLAGGVIQAANSVHGASQHSTQLAAQLTTTARQIMEASGALESALNGLSSEKNEIGAASMTVSEASTQMMREVRQLREGLAKSQLEQDARQKTLADSLETTHASLRDLLRHFEGVLNDVAAIAENSPLRSELQNVKDDMAKMLHGLEDRLTAEQARQEAARKAAPLSSQDAPPVMRQSVARLEERQQQLEERQRALEDTLPRHAPNIAAAETAAIPGPFPIVRPPLLPTPERPGWWQRLRRWLRHAKDTDASSGRKQ
jgi:hypothetical protein